MRGSWGLPAARLARFAALAAACRLGAAEPAEPAPPVAMTVDALVAAALQENPQLASLRARWAAARETPAVDRSLPNPVFTFGGMDAADRFPGAGEQRYRTEQSFPWPGKRGLRGRMAEQDAARAGFEHEAARLDVAMSVRDACYELSATRKAIELVRAEEDVLKRIAEAARSRYAAGAESQQDVIRAQAEVPMVRVRLAELDARAASLAARLNTLAGRPVGAALPLAAEPPPRAAAGDADALVAAAQAARPELLAAQAESDRSELRSALMRRESLPDFMLGIEYRRLADAEDQAMFMAGIDLPVWAGRNRASVREAERRAEADRAAVLAARRQVEFEVRDAWTGLDAALRELALYEKELIPQAQARFAASEAEYRAGRGGFIDLLESERFLFNARLMAAMAEGRVGAQRARLDRAAGRGAPRAEGRP